MSEETKRKIGASAKLRWDNQRANGGSTTRLDHSTAGPLNACKVCGEPVPPSYGKGKLGLQRWLKGHMKRAHSNKPTTAQKLEHLPELLAQGYSKRQAAAKLGVSEYVVYKTGSQTSRGTVTRSQHKLTRGSAHPEMYEKAKMLRAQGYSNNEIAKRLGVSLSAAQRWATGWKANPKPQRGKASSTFWSGMTPAERSAEMSRRHRVADAKKAAHVRQREDTSDGVDKSIQEAASEAHAEAHFQ